MGKKEKKTKKFSDAIKSKLRKPKLKNTKSDHKAPNQSESLGDDLIIENSKIVDEGELSDDEDDEDEMRPLTPRNLIILII